MSGPVMPQGSLIYEFVGSFKTQVQVVGLGGVWGGLFLNANELKIVRIWIKVHKTNNYISFKEPNILKKKQKIYI